MAWQSSAINPATTSPASDITKITNDLAVLRSVLGGSSDADVPYRLSQLLQIGTQVLLGATAVLNQEKLLVKQDAGTAQFVLRLWNAAAAGDNKLIDLLTESGGTSRGSITYNRAGGLVAYNTTSDRRAKDVVGEVDHALAAVEALRPVLGLMHGATEARPMFIADEVQAIAPYAVTGQPGAVDDDGRPVMQQLDVSALVPLLVAAVQELAARVDALEAQR